MSRFFLMVLERYGLGVLNLALLAFVSWKLCTNHLFHIANSIKENSKKLEDINKKLDSTVERVAKIEGKIE